VTLAASAQVVHFKDPVTLTAHLNLWQQTTNPAVSIWKVPFTGIVYLAAQGQVDGNGDLVKALQVYNRTTYYATWDGDATHPPAQSISTVVQVQSTTTGALSGYYGTSGSYRLYHYTNQCVQQHVGCPVYNVTVTPPSGGLSVAVTVQELFGNTWKTVAAGSAILNGNGKTSVIISYPNNGVIGHSFRVMASFTGDGSSLPSQSGLSYFKITT